MVEAEGMSLLQVIVLALIQGITEFLPVSSSAHLILPGKLLNWPDQGLAFDTSVHVGTLLAVLLFYRNQTPAGRNHRTGSQGRCHRKMQSVCTCLRLRSSSL